MQLNINIESASYYNIYQKMLLTKLYETADIKNAASEWAALLVYDVYNCVCIGGMCVHIGTCTTRHVQGPV